MKKERTIIIKKPRLRKVRNEFRMLFKLWIADVMASLRETNFSPEVQKNISRLSLLEKLSICSCLHCGNSDKDMTYRPDMKQWLCVECNSKFVYFEKLRTELRMSLDEIDEFFIRLNGEEGIGYENIRHSGLRCGGQSYPLSKSILNKMGVKQGIQNQFLELCRHYGGYCDCEVILNARDRFK